MNATANLTDVLQDALHSTGGLVGVVDALLGVCLEQRLHLRWEADCCRVRSLRGQSEVEEIRKPLSKSQFRAVLARIAALCNERCPNSVSPYGGTGTLMLGAERNRAVRVLFVNTPDEQLLDVRPASRKSESRFKLINDMLKPLSLHLQEAQEQIEQLKQRVAKLTSRADDALDIGVIAERVRAANAASEDATVLVAQSPATFGETSTELGTTSVIKNTASEPRVESVSAEAARVASHVVSEAVASTARQLTSLRQETLETKHVIAEAEHRLKETTQRIDRLRAVLITVVSAAVIYEFVQLFAR